MRQACFPENFRAFPKTVEQKGAFEHWEAHAKSENQALRIDSLLLHIKEQLSGIACNSRRLESKPQPLQRR